MECKLNHEPDSDAASPAYRKLQELQQSQTAVQAQVNSSLLSLSRLAEELSSSLDAFTQVSCERRSLLQKTLFAEAYRMLHTCGRLLRIIYAISQRRVLLMRFLWFSRGTLAKFALLHTRLTYLLAQLRSYRHQHERHVCQIWLSYLYPTVRFLPPGSRAHIPYDVPPSSSSSSVHTSPIHILGRHPYLCQIPPLPLSIANKSLDGEPCLSSPLPLNTTSSSSSPPDSASPNTHLSCTTFSASLQAAFPRPPSPVSGSASSFSAAPRALPLARIAAHYPPYHPDTHAHAHTPPSTRCAPLPAPVVWRVLSFLPLGDLPTLMLVCRDWATAIARAPLWADAYTHWARARAAIARVQALGGYVDARYASALVAQVDAQRRQQARAAVAYDAPEQEDALGHAPSRTPSLSSSVSSALPSSSSSFSSTFSSANVHSSEHTGLPRLSSLSVPTSASVRAAALAPCDTDAELAAAAWTLHASGFAPLPAPLSLAEDPATAHITLPPRLHAPAAALALAAPPVEGQLCPLPSPCGLRVGRYQPHTHAHLRAQPHLFAGVDHGAPTYTRDLLPLPPSPAAAPAPARTDAPLMPPSVVRPRRTHHPHYLLSIARDVDPDRPRHTLSLSLRSADCCDDECSSTVVAPQALPGEPPVAAPDGALVHTVLCGAQRDALSSACNAILDQRTHLTQTRLARARLLAELDGAGAEKAGHAERVRRLQEASARAHATSAASRVQASSDGVTCEFLRGLREEVEARDAAAEQAWAQERAALQEELRRVHEETEATRREQALAAELRLHQRVLAKEVRLLRGELEEEALCHATLLAAAKAHGLVS